MRKLLLMLAVLPLPVLAADVTVSWTNPTTRVDGSPIGAGELATTTLYYGLCGDTPAALDVPQPATSVDITGLAYGEYCFTATVTDVYGLESQLSAQVTKTLNPTNPPNPPTLLTVEQVAYEIKVKGNGDIMLGRAIGTVPLGTECSDAFQLGDYYQIPLDAVSVDKPKLQSNLIVARCAIS